MRIAITAQIKNGLLWEAVKRCGSQSALARQLRVSPTVLGEWLNFKTVPAYDGETRVARKAEIEAKLIEIVGATFDEVFPAELRSEAFKARHKQIDQTVDIPIEQLASSGAVPLLPAAPDEQVFSTELRQKVAETVATLNPKEQEIISLRFGLGANGAEHTLSEVAERLQMKRETVYATEVKALRKLRHPSRAVPLRAFVADQ